MKNILIGQQAERKAYYYLQRQGLKPIARNYRCRMGEIDLVMQDHKTIVFVEVRLRNNSCFGQSIETIGFYKQQRIIKAAQCFLLQRFQYQHLNGRFDVIGIDFDGKITWIKNAFTVQY